MPQNRREKIKMGKIALATVFQIDYEKNNIDLKHYTVKDENVKNTEKRFYEYRRLFILFMKNMEMHIKPSLKVKPNQISSINSKF